MLFHVLLEIEQRECRLLRIKGRLRGCGEKREKSFDRVFVIFCIDIWNVNFVIVKE